MRTPRPAAIAASFSFAALLAVVDLPSGPGEVSAHTPRSDPTTQLAALRDCESSGNYRANTGNGYSGAYQFSASTWQSLGYRGRASDAPPEVQDQAALRLASTKGWSQWPACSRKLGLKGRAAPPPPSPLAALTVAAPAPTPPVAEPAPAPGGRNVGRELIRWARGASAPA